MSEQVKRVGIFAEIPEHIDKKLEKLKEVGFDKKLILEYALSLFFSKTDEEILKELVLYKAKLEGFLPSKPAEKVKSEWGIYE